MSGDGDTHPAQGGPSEIAIQICVPKVGFGREKLQIYLAYESQHQWPQNDI